MTLRHNKDPHPTQALVKRTGVSIPALAIGAVALGALAIGALAIGRLAIGKASIRRLEIDQLVIRDLKVLNTSHEDEAPSETRASDSSK